MQWHSETKQSQRYKNREKIRLQQFKLSQKRKHTSHAHKQQRTIWQRTTSQWSSNMYFCFYIIFYFRCLCDVFSIRTRIELFKIVASGETHARLRKIIERDEPKVDHRKIFASQKFFENFFLNFFFFNFIFNKYFNKLFLSILV